MTDPFFIEGPAVISFSGGRTSGYMLRRILDAGLQPDVRVVFANTGKEREETLAFVHECETQWSVPVVWVEYVRQYLPDQRSDYRIHATAMARAESGRIYPELPPGVSEPGFRVVTFATASRHGEPFENLIDLMGLPSIGSRLCSSELKTRVIKKTMQAFGYDRWDNVVGIRADEQARVSRMRVSTGQRWENVLPLADAGVSKRDVLAFWRAAFDLRLPLDVNGETYGGNCDLCFLKNAGKRARIAREEPSRVQWWAKQEARTGMFFRDQQAAYTSLLIESPQISLFGEDVIECACTD